MAKLGIVLDQRNKQTDRFPVVIRVSHKSKWKYLQTGFKVTTKEWNESKKEIKKPFPNTVRANAKIRKKFSIASDVISEHNAVMKKLSMKEVYNLIHDRTEEVDNTRIGDPITVTDIAKKTYLKEYSKIVLELKRKTNTEKYVSSMEKSVEYFLKFHGNDKLLISDIDVTFIKNLEAYYAVNSQKGDSVNGLGVNLRNIRVIINAAIADKTTELTLENNPFGKHGYSIKSSATKKRATKLTEIEKIINYKIKKNSALWHHKNYFMFYFYMRGMNFVDLANLRMNNVEEDRLIYRRQKTKRSKNSKEFNIKLTSEARKILKHYTKNKKPDDLIFPILAMSEGETNPRKLLTIYENKRANHNRRLKTLAKMAGIKTDLTTYVARHSFATAALQNGVSKAEIGDMLGHANYHVTETYLAGFEKKTLDDAADKVFNFSKKKSKNKK